MPVAVEHFSRISSCFKIFTLWDKIHFAFDVAKTNLYYIMTLQTVGIYKMHWAPVHLLVRVVLHNCGLKERKKKQPRNPH